MDEEGYTGGPLASGDIRLITPTSYSVVADVRTASMFLVRRGTDGGAHTRGSWGMPRALPLVLLMQGCSPLRAPADLGAPRAVQRP